MLLATLGVHAATSDDMLIYSDRFHNGWVDNWSYTTRYATNNPVQSGSHAMAIVPGGQWQAWWLKAGTSVDTAIYTNVSFWLYGSTSGQAVGVTGELGGSDSWLPTVWVTAPASTWQQFTVSLASLGIQNKSNLTGFRIGNGATAPATVH